MHSSMPPLVRLAGAGALNFAGKIAPHLSSSRAVEVVSALDGHSKEDNRGGKVAKEMSLNEAMAASEERHQKDIEIVVQLQKT